MKYPWLVRFKYTVLSKKQKVTLAVYKKGSKDRLSLGIFAKVL